MRCLEKNKQTIYYRTFNAITEIGDSTAYTETIVSREKTIAYNPYQTMKASISPASGNVTLEGNGIVKDYTHIMITDNMACPINVDTLVWVNRTPTSTSLDADFRITRVSKSLNHITYQLREIVGD